ncbi:MAG: AzlD domain-containing protein [Aeromicrobium sp.]|uniref:AzlD domain-containing protein n=1 Tax=Aeromicrobium sp. TaxID=1871063 RepID=UPI003C3F65F7
MTAVWVGIALSAAGCFAFKLAGMSVPERVLAHRLTVRISDLIPVGLLGALIAVQVLADGTRVSVDARLAALGVAAVLLWLRVPFLPMVTLSAASAALLRQL